MPLTDRLVGVLIRLGLLKVVRLLRPRVHSTDYILNVEREKLLANHMSRLGSDQDPRHWSGIGLSGGGIRSASLSLGVIQALAECDILKRFDYISSVSGGGYLAGALQWWWFNETRSADNTGIQPRFGLGPKDFPYGPARIASTTEQPITVSARSNLAFLRSHSAYLTPGNGLTSWSMLAVLTRTTIISLFIWVPLVAAIFVLLLSLDYSFLENWATRYHLVSPIGTIIPPQWLTPCNIEISCRFTYRTIYALLLYFYYGIVAAFFCAAIIFAYLTRSSQGGGTFAYALRLALVALGSGYLAYLAWKTLSYFDNVVTIVVAFGILICAVSFTMFISEVTTPNILNASYWLRRKLEVAWGWTFLPSLALLAAATVPLIPYFIAISLNAPAKGALAGLFGILSGIVSGAYGYYTFLRNLLPSLTGQIAASVGSLVYIYATLVIAYTLSIFWSDGDVLFGEWGGIVTRSLEGWLAIALVLSLFANINYVGLHRFYRDRLMEAFMPPDSAVKSGISDFSPVADNLLISDLLVNAKDRSPAPVPYPIINTNVIMLNDKEQKVAARGGDNFVISPLFLGSSVTGWRDSLEFIDDNGPLTLASSIAASGAAATASAGYIGTGITMNPLVAAVMSLLNIRLGLWVPNPSRRWPRPFNAIPTFLHPGLISGMFSMRHSRRSRFVELTDGGHFENLGLYELARRKLSLMLIVDGEADPNISLSSLVSATRRIEQDFGATIEFDATAGKGPERLIMYDQQGYPKDLRYAKSPFLVAQIRYNDGSTGVIVYIKSTLIKDMDFTTAGYLATNPTFPHQSTVDQFFDQDQFDAYRYLGYDTASQVIRDLQLTSTIGSQDRILDAYKKLP